MDGSRRRVTVADGIPGIDVLSQGDKTIGVRESVIPSPGPQFRRREVREGREY
jgi:hypothetical protein